MVLVDINEVELLSLNLHFFLIYWELYLARGLKMHSGCANDLYSRSVAIDPPPNMVVLHKCAA